MTKVTAIIQSSWKSDIFEYKSLFKLANDRTVLEVIVSSLRKMDVVGEIVLATSDRTEDQLLIQEADRLGIKHYAGSLTNLIERIKLAHEPYAPGVILKIDGNKPLFDPVEAEKLVHAHIENGAEYSYNGHYRGVVYGTDCEVVSSEALSRIDSSKLTINQQGSGTMYLRANPQLFKTFAKESATYRPMYRVVLERQMDAQVINNIVSHVDVITNESIIKYLDENPIVAAYNQLEKPKEIGLNKIMLFPDKLKALQSVSPTSPDLSYPISVELSLTNRCNFKCVWCSDLELRENQGNGDLPMETIQRLAKDLAMNGTRGVVIEGGGEPTVVRNFDEICQVFKSEGLSLGLITNGSRKLAVDTVKKFDWIRVSLDASCHDEMLRLKGWRHFETVIENIIFYAEHCKTVGIGYVATNQNTSQIEPLILRLRETNVSYVQFRPVVDHPELSPTYDFDYLKKYQTWSFAVITDGMKENIIKGNNGLPCVSHSLSTVITANGGVYICGRLNIHDWMKPMGNINTESFYDIWHGEERKRQSGMVGESFFCKKACPECRLTKFNIELDKLKQIKTSDFI